MKFIPDLFGDTKMESIDNLRKLFVISAKQGGLAIKISTKGAERAHEVLKESTKVMVKSLTEG